MGLKSVAHGGIGATIGGTIGAAIGGPFAPITAPIGAAIGGYVGYETANPPKPPAIPLAPPAANPPTAANATVSNSGNAAKLRAAQGAGAQGGTNVTGGQGLVTPASTTQSVLLG